jgi:DNA-binding HxlR family transcriptional regulator
MSKLCQKFEQAGMILGKRWVTLILYELLSGPKRFNGLQDQLGISSKVLSERLKYLEDEHILTRKIYNETPIRIEYTLTTKGFALKPIIESLNEWSQSYCE